MLGHLGNESGNAYTQRVCWKDSSNKRKETNEDDKDLGMSNHG